MSCGAPIRPTGVWRTMPVIVSSRSAERFRIGVSINPGAMALTVIPLEPSSSASALLKPAMPALAAE